MAGQGGGPATVKLTRAEGWQNDPILMNIDDGESGERHGDILKKKKIQRREQKNANKTEYGIHNRFSDILPR